MRDNMEPMFADNQRQKDHTINIQKVASRVATYWPSIAVCVIIAMLCAFVYLRYATPQYAVHAKVLVKSDQQESNGALLAGLGIQGGSTNIESEIEIFKSRVLMRHVVEDMHLNIAYYVPGKIQTTNLYNDAPFRIIPLYGDSSVKTSYTYNISVNNGVYDITSGANKWTAHSGDTLDLTVGRIYIERNPLAGHMYDDARTFVVVISPSEGVADGYLGSLTIDLVNRQANILLLSLKDVDPQRGEDVLDRLIMEYQRSNVEDKNQVAEGTIQFIDSRLAGVSGELSGVEKNIEQFKVTNSLTDVGTRSRTLSENSTDNVRELMQKEVQLKVLESLETYIQNNNNTDRVMPATLIAQDATLSRIIEDYNNLQGQRQRMLLSYTETSNYVKNIDVQLEDLRSGMKSYIASLRRGYQVSVNELRSQANLIQSKVKEVPGKERQYLDYERQQQIKQELYLFLLKKREETALSKSATVANLKIVDPSRRDSNPVSPKRSRIFLMALVIGMIVPGIRVAAKELFNDRVSSRSDIEQLTSLPIIAEIAHNDKNETLVVKKESKTIIAEQFRALRTNLQFLMPGKDEKVILLTSSMSGEGKSFISINLANAIALSGKKVVLMELDLRKPKVAEHLGLDNARGFSTCIIGRSAIDEIVLPSKVSDNLFVITSGPVPPDPSELIMMPAVQQLFAELKERFDHIIIDSAPVGLVTDAQLLAKHANAVLYIMRQGYTYKAQLRSANDLYVSGKMQNMGLILNDVKTVKGSGYGYGYGANGSGYFEEGSTNGASRFQQIFKRK